MREEEAVGWTAFEEREEPVPAPEEAAPSEEVEEPTPPTLEEEAEELAAPEEELPEAPEMVPVAEEAPPAEEPIPAPEEAAPPEEVEEPAPPTLEEEAEERVTLEEAIEKAPTEDLEKFVAARKAYAEEHPEDDEAQLELGRVLWQVDRRQDAVEAYDELVARGELLGEVIADLENYTEQWPDARVMQSLGDAYMKADRLEDALNTYRQALAVL